MKYWVYVNNEITGPYDKEKLFELSDFGPSTLVCPQTPVGEKTEDWKEAINFPEIAAAFNSQNTPIAQTPAQKGAEQPPHQDGQILKDSRPSLKPLSPLRQEQASPTQQSFGEQVQKSAENAPSGGFTVKRLGSAGKKDSPPAGTAPLARNNEPPAHQVSGAMPSDPQTPKAMPTAGGEPEKPASRSFDPLTLSQISRKAQNISDADIKPKPHEPPKSEIPPEIDQSVTAGQSSLLPAELSTVVEEIKMKLANLEKSSVAKQDFSFHAETVTQKLDKMAESISMIQAGNTSQQMLFDKIYALDASISEIKTLISMGSDVKPRQEAILKGNQPEPAFNTVRIPKQEEPPPAETAKTTSKDEIKDEGTKAKKRSVIKVIFKGLLSMILLIGVATTASIALKQAGIFDVTKFVDLTQFSRIPFMNFITGKPAAARTEPEPEIPADLSNEVILFAKSYSITPEGPFLEALIQADAREKKTDPDLATWSAAPLAGMSYEVLIKIPMPDMKTQISYAFEVDYDKKIIKPLDEYARKIMDLLAVKKEDLKPANAPSGLPQATAKEGTPAKETHKPMTARPGKGKTSKLKGKGKRTPAKTGAKTQALPQKPAKQIQAEDEDYEYVYVDEDEAGASENEQSAGEEEEYILPGIPKKQQE
ncbi:MAG: hypothetical protein HY746_07505 [Elusimicrobia bacterium]|nr:hypothetical protein [Elusimicrobiota bacterium]